MVSHYFPHSSRSFPAHSFLTHYLHHLNHRWLRNLPLDKSGQHFNAGVLSLADRVSLMEWSVLTQVRGAVGFEVLLFERGCGCMVLSGCGCQLGTPLSTLPSPTLFHYIMNPSLSAPFSSSVEGKGAAAHTGSISGKRRQR